MSGGGNGSQPEERAGLKGGAPRHRQLFEAQCDLCGGDESTGELQACDVCGSIYHTDPTCGEIILGVAEANVWYGPTCVACCEGDGGGGGEGGGGVGGGGGEGGGSEGGTATFNVVRVNPNGDCALAAMIESLGLDKDITPAELRKMLALELYELFSSEEGLFQAALDELRQLWSEHWLDGPPPPELPLPSTIDAYVQLMAMGGSVEFALSAGDSVFLPLWCGAVDLRAAARALGVGIRVYKPGSGEGRRQVLPFTAADVEAPDPNAPVAHILYTGGHYDALVPAQPAAANTIMSTAEEGSYFSEQMIAAVNQLSNALGSHLTTVANAALVGGPAAAFAELCPYRRAQGRAHPDDPRPNGEWAALLSAAATALPTSSFITYCGALRNNDLLTRDLVNGICARGHWNLDPNTVLLAYMARYLGGGETCVVTGAATGEGVADALPEGTRLCLFDAAVPLGCEQTISHHDGEGAYDDVPAATAAAAGGASCWHHPSSSGKTAVALVRALRPGGAVVIAGLATGSSSAIPVNRRHPAPSPSPLRTPHTNTAHRPALTQSKAPTSAVCTRLRRSSRSLSATARSRSCVISS